MKNITWCLDALYVEFLKKEKDDDGTVEKIQSAREEVATASFVNKYHSCKYCVHAKVCSIHTPVIEMFEYNRDGYFSKNFEQAIEKTQQAIGSSCSNYLFPESE